MENILTDINRNEVLKYLGYRGGAVDNETEKQIEEACYAVLQKSTPRYTYAVFDIESNGGICLSGTLFKPQGSDIAGLLEGCGKCIMMAATLGAGFENMLKRTQIVDMAKAVILDSCGSSAIENICNNVEQMLAEEYGKRGLYLTDRFSPGYGDMPLSQQKDFVSVLDTARKIGVSLTAGGMLVPTKSVTAIMGISETPKNKRKRGCEYCSNFADCKYRREGIICD